MSRRQLVFTLCACINFTTLICVSAQIPRPNNNSKTISHAPPAYAIASVASSLLNSTLCQEELLNFRNAVDQRVLWSLKMLDSSGDFQSGFFYGNNYWLGSRSQCIDTMSTVPLQISKSRLLNNTLYRDPQKEIPPFKVNYYAAYLKHNSTLQYHVNFPNEDIITLGLCLPASCSVHDISFILKRIFHDRVLLINGLYSADLELIQVKTLKNDYKWFNGAALVICVILVLSVLMVIIGTIYDRFVSSNEENKIDTNGNGTVEEMEMEVASSSEESKIGKVLICFSAYANTKVIFNTKVHADTLPIIHGLKFLNMCWLIMGHTILYMIDYIDNKIWTLKFTAGFINQVVTTTPIGVDTYFFLSGLLVAYFYIKDKMDKGRIQPLTYKAKLNEFFVLVTRRFIRLTPAYMMVLAISQLSSAWFNETSQFYVHERPHETCPKYWWRNLLYINNLFGLKTMCMSWSWYLSADMQFFSIAVALLILSTIYFYIAVAILAALLIGSIVLTGYLSYIYEYVPTLDEQYRLVDVLYLPPWVRITPYIVGMITGYILTQLNGKLLLKRRTIILCWCLGSACNIIVLFSMHQRQIPILPSAIYIALHKGVWAVGIAWIVIACLTQHGGIVCQFLSFKGWAPFSRLSYCAYLINPVVIQSFRLLSETSVHFEFIPLTIFFVGYCIIIYLCSYILSLIVESPYILLVRRTMQARSRRKYKWRNSEKL
ncbi:PREDICTED: nose resistant to fluoxetine protein 6-like [Vollenhovia emeryi]|uniref:nose resistant to fluoxetine protein 6-like n=1 Tax=Vollenhovia emeryi TaxID=411798 RepID=UPI0005F5572B|nr:PREDICTED: nose resistant to fluoxetine protein 6-like [Vollenhovia emeryi]